MERTVAVTVNKADQAAPTGLSATAESIDGKADGSISGVTEGETYCAAQTVTVAEKNVDSVKVNGTPVTLDDDGCFTLVPDEGEQTIVVTDKAGNKTEMTVTVNDGHTYEWQNENGLYWQKCKVCGHETDKKDVPAIAIDGADIACVTPDYTFTVTLPDGLSDTVAYQQSGAIRYPITLRAGESGVYTGTISAAVFAELANAGQTTLTITVYSRVPDSYMAEATKSLEISLEHTGGEADCTHKAKCEICGEEYGDVNAANHDALEHVEANAATTEAEGNIEYWHCEDCGKCFRDKNGKDEIALADTVIAKLTPERHRNRRRNPRRNPHPPRRPTPAMRQTFSSGFSC